MTKDLEVEKSVSEKASETNKQASNSSSSRGSARGQKVVQGQGSSGVEGFLVESRYDSADRLKYGWISTRITTLLNQGLDPCWYSETDDYE